MFKFNFKYAAKIIEINIKVGNLFNCYCYPVIFIYICDILIEFHHNLMNNLVEVN